MPAAVAVFEILVLLLPLPLIAVANWHDAPPSGQGTPRRAAAALGATIWMLLALVAAACILLALVSLTLTPRQSSAAGGGGIVAYSGVLLVTGAAAALLIAEPVRTELARVIPIDPRSAVHASALILSTVVVGSQLANQLAVDVLSQQASTGAALTPQDLVAQEVPFLLAAALGVGLFIRRSPSAALDRLGLVWPTPWQLALGLGAALLFFVFGTGMDMLDHKIAPATAQKVQAANQHLFGHLGSPLGIATIALSAGICEEALFRGAMQPRLGILWTAIVFTAVHTQYGLSLDAAAVLVLAIGLGLVRRFTNTTTSTACHVVYNSLVGVGVTGFLLGWTVVIGFLLVAAGVAAFFTGRLGSLRPAP